MGHGPKTTSICVPAACNDAVSADKFLLLFLSDDESLSVPSTGPIQGGITYLS